jgi:two-component system, OmpR family, response regulator
VGKEIYSTHDIADILSMDVSTVTDWIDQKKLTAYKTPGGHRRVHRKDLLSFLKAYNMPVSEAALRDEKVVLLVEDDADFRQALRKIVESLPGTRVYEVEDGFAAGRRVEELKPDVVLLDLFLPGLNGFKVCENIRQDPRLSDVRIVAMSGQDTEENIKRIRDAGADIFVAKPMGLPRLRQILESIFAGNEMAVGPSA